MCSGGSKATQVAWGSKSRTDRPSVSPAGAASSRSTGVPCAALWGGRLSPQERRSRPVPQGVGRDSPWLLSSAFFLRNRTPGEASGCPAAGLCLWRSVAVLRGSSTDRPVWEGLKRHCQGLLGDGLRSLIIMQKERKEK